ncbi:MAG: 16S rRNA (adenine(1518)-N(6)/adenine(1519)-N(6))-dimethyltransferase RsmA [Candidatus Dormiibacterota bacterium]
MAPRQRKRLGQHFLTDETVLERVVAAPGIGPEDVVLEVGAGAGTLTARLLPLARHVVAVELDERWLPALRHNAPGAEIVAQDVLALDLPALFPAGGEIVVGNIPYYLTGALLRKLLRPPLPRRLSLVVQREVAQRWCGIGGWSLATVAAQTLTEPRLELEIPPDAFDPPPQVFSALCVLDVRPAPAVDVPDLDRFFRFVEAVFQFRRKQLGGSLARITGRTLEDVLRILEAAGIAPERRPETLDLPSWQALFLELSG